MGKPRETARGIVVNLVQAPCPDCDGSGCDVCEHKGHVLVPEDVRTVPSTSEISPSSTEHVEEGAEESAEVDTQEGAQRPHRLTSETAREAARLRWAKQRERETAAAQSAETVGSDIIVRTTVPVSLIIKRLSSDAQKGNHQAARELRSWLADVDREEHTQLSDLDKRTRQSLLARLLREEEEERAEQADSVDGLLPEGLDARGLNATPAAVGVPS